MGWCGEEEEEEEADSAAVFWPWLAWWAGLEDRKGKLFHGRLLLTDGPILLTRQRGGDHRRHRTVNTYSLVLYMSTHTCMLSSNPMWYGILLTCLVCVSTPDLSDSSVP